MKRKLSDRDDVPVESTGQTSTHAAATSFDSFGLDARLLQALVNQKFAKPTPVQAQMVPLAIEGRDVVGTKALPCQINQLLTIAARANTGSGKTAAYILPVLQSILRRKSTSGQTHRTSALILVPTKELASQVNKVVASFSAFCSKDIHTIDLTPSIHDPAQRVLLASSPDIVISTPSRALLRIDDGSLDVSNVTHLVIDEPDLVLSYGHDEDCQTILKQMPLGVQTFMVSATLSTEVHAIKGLFCKDPVVLDLVDDDKTANHIGQYYVQCGEDDKFLLLFAIFKLKLLKGKYIVFAGDVDRCYRLKLFLEQFAIKSCVLNSELPVNCRIHVVEEFNKNVYDIVIATDEHEIMGSLESASARKRAGNNQAEVLNGLEVENRTSALPEEPKKRSKKTSNEKKDREYGISRGIDFQNVGCVLNFDLPLSTASYTHRIGRTARAGKSGIAMSFVIPKPLYRKHKHVSFPSTQHDETVLASIIAVQEKKGQQIQQHQMDMTKLEGFRYRIQTALSAVTAGAIRSARIRELRQEMLKSEKLKRHLEENPDDLRYLRHDLEARTAKVQPHLKHVPDYLIPAGGDGKVGEGQGLAGEGFVGLGRQSENRIKKMRAVNKARGHGRKGGKGANPLKTLSSGRRR